MVIAFILSLLVLPPLFITNQVDKQFKQLISSVNSMPYYSVEVIQYDKGWFASSGRVILDFDDSSMKFSIPIDFSTKSGWLTDEGLGLMSFSLSVPAQQLKSVLTWQNDQPLYQLQGGVSLSGNLSFVDRVAAIEVKEHDSISGTLSTYIGQAVTQEKQIQYVGHIDHIKLLVNSTQLLVKNLSVSSTVPSNIFDIYGKTFWYDSDFELSIEELSAQDNTERGDSIYLRAFSISGNSLTDIKQNVGAMDLNYQAEQVDVSGWIATDTKLAMNIANIDLDFINGFHNLMKQLDRLPDEQTANATMGYFQDNLFSLLSYEPEFNVTTLQAQIPQGSIKGFVKTKLHNVQTLPYQLDDISFWLAHTLANSDIEMDKAVLKVITEQVFASQLRNDPQATSLTDEQFVQISQNRADMLIKTGLENGFFFDAGGFYKTQLQLKDGVATINELTIPIPYNR